MTVGVVCALAVFVALAAIGVYFWSEQWQQERKSVQQTRIVHLPTVQIEITGPGLSVEEMCNNVAVPVEEAVRKIDTIQCVYSHIEEGKCRIVVSFPLGRDLYVATQAVRGAIANMQRQLHEGLCTPLLQKGPADVLPVTWLILTSPNRPVSELAAIAEKELRLRFQSVPGVGRVALHGAPVGFLQATIDPMKLAAFGLDVVDIQQALAETGDKLNDLENRVVASRDGNPVRLRDVAAVRTSFENRGSVRLNGQRAVALAVWQEHGVEAFLLFMALATAERQLEASLPPDVQVIAWFVGFPASSSHHLLVCANGLTGASTDERNRCVEQIENALRERLVNGGSGVLTITDAAAIAPCNVAEMIVDLPASISSDDFRKALPMLPGVRFQILAIDNREWPILRRCPVELALTGSDRDLLLRWAEEIDKRLEREPALVDAAVSLPTSRVTRQVRLDRDKMAQLNISARRVAAAAALAFDDEPMTVNPTAGIRLTLAGNRDDWQQTPVRGANGQMVPLGNLVEVRNVVVPSTIERFNHRPMIGISANAAAGVSVDQARAKCNDIAAAARQALSLPDDYKIEDRFP
jgi:multidrug efflux pump subunit AcrB